MNKNRAERSDSRITSPAGKQTRAEQPMTLLYAVAALFSLLGLADAIYLTIEHVTGQSVRCTIVAGCSEVLSSSYSTVAGVPLAAVGAVAYFCVFSLATLAAFGYRSAGRLLMVIVGLMFVVTLWSIYLQAFVIHAYCQFCLFSAAITITLTAIFFFVWRRST